MFSIEESKDSITINFPCGATETAADESHLQEFERGRGLDGSINMATCARFVGIVAQLLEWMQSLDPDFHRQPCLAVHSRPG